MMPRKLLLFLACISVFTPLCAQNVSDRNTIAWFGTFNTFEFSKHWAFYAEFQLRRVKFLEDPFQDQVRTGFEYTFDKDISVMAGYFYSISFPYGDYATGSYHTPEHRIFQQVNWSMQRGRFSVNHRFRAEQRWVGEVSQLAPTYEVKGWDYINRVRFQLKITYPLNHCKLEDKTWYLATSGEIFLDLGRSTDQDVFDQARLMLVAGYQLNKMLKFETGWIRQNTQKRRTVNGSQSFLYHYNDGFVFSIYYTKPYAPKENVANPESDK